MVSTNTEHTTTTVSTDSQTAYTRSMQLTYPEELDATSCSVFRMGLGHTTMAFLPKISFGKIAESIFGVMQMEGNAR